MTDIKDKREFLLCDKRGDKMAKKKHVYNNFRTKEDWAKVNPINKAVMDDYILELKANQRKPSTIKQYTNDIKIMLIVILKQYDNRNILELNKREFRNISIYLKNECGQSNARVNRMMSAIRSMLTYCEDSDEWEEYEFNTASKVKGLPKEEVREIVFLTDEQILKIKDELVRREDYQKACILMMAYTSSCRKNELFQCMKKSFVKGELLTDKVVGKRGKKFPIRYDQLTLELGQKYLEQRGEDEYDEMWTMKDKDGNYKPVQVGAIYGWFKSMNKILEELEGEYLDFNVHSLRHSSLDNLKEGTHYLCEYLGYPNGVPLEKLQLIAHHQSSDTTAGYLKNRDEEELDELYSGANKN